MQLSAVNIVDKHNIMVHGLLLATFADTYLATSRLVSLQDHVKSKGLFWAV